MTPSKSSYLQLGHFKVLQKYIPDKTNQNCSQFFGYDLTVHQDFVTDIIIQIKASRFDKIKKGYHIQIEPCHSLSALRTFGQESSLHLQRSAEINANTIQKVYEKCSN